MTGTKPAGKAAAKIDKRWQREMGMLQSAMQKLKNGDEVQLSTLPILRKTTGADTQVQKVKVIKAAIKDAHWTKSYGAALATASLTAIHEEKKVAAAKLAALENKALRADAIAAEKVARWSPQKPAAPTHQMHPHPQTQSDALAEWKLVVPQNPKAAKKASARGNVELAKLKLAATALKKAEVARKKADSQLLAKLARQDANAESASEQNTPSTIAATGWQNQFQQGFREPLGTSWADDVEQSVNGGKQDTTAITNSKNAKSKAFPKKTALSRAAETQLQLQKPNKKAKLDALAAIAALAGEAEAIIEAEAQHDYLENVAEGLPARPTFCGDQLGLPIASLYATLKQETNLEMAASREERQKLARVKVLARQDCINKLSALFPAEAMTATLTLIGHATHPKASLLGLPESVQEQIYRLVLVEDQPFRITPSNHKQPALLRTCQQLRMETLWIFEIENTFSLEVVDSKPVVPKNYTSHWARQVPCKLETSGTPKWDGLEKWLKAYHEDGVPGLFIQENDMPMPWDVCGKAFELVLSLRAIFPEISFEEMAPMLDIWKKTVELQQEVWSWD